MGMTVTGHTDGSRLQLEKDILLVVGNPWAQNSDCH